MNQEQLMRRWLRRLLCASAALLVGTAGVYFYKFAPGNWLVLSNSSVEWNNFGTFVGGVAGPCFGFMAFYAAVETILMQAKQLDVARQQAMSDDLQRVLVGLSDRIEAQLSAVSRMVRLGHDPENVRDLIAEFGSEVLALGELPTDPMQLLLALDLIGKRDAIRQRFERHLAQVDPVLMELDAMCWCLERHVSRGGDGSELQEYYRYRYADLVRHLVALGLIPTTSKVPAILGDQ